MNIDRYMVNLFFEIKRNIPSHQQSAMKISDPELGKVMSELYRQTEDQNIRLLTQIFLQRAGENWLKDAEKIVKPVSTSPTESIKKGFAERPPENTSSELALKPKRFYRGQLIED